MTEQFDAIAERTIREAEDVDCSLAEFAVGLKAIEVAIRERRELAEDEASKADE